MRPATWQHKGAAFTSQGMLSGFCCGGGYSKLHVMAVRHGCAGTCPMDSSNASFAVRICRYVSGFLPRAVYASGKASSAAGLTASVIKVCSVVAWRGV
jgi:hypothetical protein